MSASKVQKKLPKRVSNEKSKTRRAKSWVTSQREKMNNITQQAKREKINAERGFSGKQLDNAIRRYAKEFDLNYRILKDGMDKSAELNIASEMGLI